MLKDITLGQYFSGSSIIHRLDPRTKMIVSILFIVAIFSAKGILGLSLLVLTAALIVLMSGISFKVILKSLKPIVFVLLFTVILNIFLTKSTAEEPLFEFYFISVYRDGIWRAVYMALRVIILIVGSSVLISYTTSPIMLTDAIESLLKPLKKIKVPVHEFAMMMSIALRFIPTLIEETEKIMNAQKARGADFSNGSIVKRAKALIPVLIPLFVSSFKRAEDLAMAMECRCYHGGEGRTRLVKLEYKVKDFIFMLAFLVLIALVIFLNQFQIGYMI
ncbi:MAG: energy-coupling factor transporter transmembrane protein EcfT, partial [Clostridia bacterium]|nr:energy-coupling factor transporter transmembrane protein EcfT [Clostridia bacterium]